MSDDEALANKQIV